MKRRLHIDCGAAETRAAIFEGDDIRRFWFGPAQGDERLPREVQPGDIFVGRIKTVSKALKGAFVDIGAARDGFLPVRKNDAAPIEGAKVIVKARRPALGGKGAVLTLDWACGLQSEEKSKIETMEVTARVGALTEPAGAALQAVMQNSAAGMDIVVNDVAAKLALDARNVACAFAEDFSITRLIDEAIEQSLERTINLPHGARLHIHETEAGALFDVDLAAAADGMSGEANDKVNAAAARRAMTELSRRAIGGRVLIDFLPPSSPAARRSLADTLVGQLSKIDRARFGKLAPDGLCDFTTPRERLSLLEIATEPAGMKWPVDGRRLTLDWSAKAAVRSLESALRAFASQQIRLLVAPDIGAYLSGERPQWADRLAQKFGARFTIEVGAAMESRSHEVA